MFSSHPHISHKKPYIFLFYKKLLSFFLLFSAKTRFFPLFAKNQCFFTSFLCPFFAKNQCFFTPFLRKSTMKRRPLRGFFTHGALPCPPLSRGTVSLTYRLTSSLKVSQPTVILPLVSNPHSGGGLGGLGQGTQSPRENGNLVRM